MIGGCCCHLRTSAQPHVPLSGQLISVRPCPIVHPCTGSVGVLVPTRPQRSTSCSATVWRWSLRAPRPKQGHLLTNNPARAPSNLRNGRISTKKVRRIVQRHKHVAARSYALGALTCGWSSMKLPATVTLRRLYGLHAVRAGSHSCRESRARGELARCGCSPACGLHEDMDSNEALRAARDWRGRMTVWSPRPRTC